MQTEAQRPVQAVLDTGYADRLTGYDELWSGEGIRPAWSRLMGGLEQLGGEALLRRQMDASRLLRESGVTYNVYGDPQGRHRTWSLDPVPLMLGAEDWAGLEAGLRQRAELLNLILTDLYGPRQLIKRGVLPPELIFSHPGFLRACDGVRISGPQQLLLYGADVGRGPDGRWWVFSDRTQVPTGAGYALENRMVMARVMANELRDNQVQRLTSFFRHFTRNLQRVAQHKRENPYIVVLTPGPGSETYFEHGYLAAHMGYPLVQGGDLLVRDNRVWMKSIDGLKQVDIILRRVDDVWCDPLELRADSMLGVPGLLSAARAGHVVIANPLGSAVLESRGLLPFLEACARYFLKEDLRLPSVATWWCGQPRECSHVLANLDSMVIKSTWTGGGTWLGPALSSREKAQLIERIQACPREFVGQEHTTFSTTPSLVESGQLEPRHLMFRGFLVANGQGYEVMPGGLTRVARDRDSLFISNQRGAVSKDTWVLTRDAHRQAQPAMLVSAPQASPHESRLPSRTAENLFWAGRYAERVEGLARLLRTAMDKLGECEDYGDEADVATLERLLGGVTVLTASYPGFVGEGAELRRQQPQPELMSLVRDRERRGSIPEVLGYFLNAAYHLRDLWSGDTWRMVDALEDSLERLQTCPPRLFEVRAELDRLVVLLNAFSGNCAESMRHDQGWSLMDVGRRLERGVQMAQLLECTLVVSAGESVEPLLVEALLACTESLMTQRRRFRNASQTASAIALLVLDERHPRAIAYQVERLSRRLTLLTSQQRRTDPLGERYSPEVRLAMAVDTTLKLGSARVLATPDALGQRNALGTLLQRVREQLWELSQELSRNYFTHTPGVQQLTPLLQLPNA